MTNIWSNSEHDWLRDTDHSSKLSHKFAVQVSGAPSTSQYYYYPMQFQEEIGYYARPRLELNISNRVARLKETFYLCNMPLWAKHLGLNNPWPLVATAALGILTCQNNDNFLRLDPGKVRRAMNPMGIRTVWSQDSGWSSAGTAIQNTLEENFPLDGWGNPSFTALAKYPDLHFSSVYYTLMALTESSQDSSGINYI